MIKNIKSYSLFSLYLIGFIFALETALPNYVNSSYLGTLMPAKFLGLIYALEAVLAVIGFLLMPKVLKKIGNFRLASILLLCEMASLLGLAVFKNAYFVVSSLVINLLAITFISFALDIFVEGHSADSVTGKIRGTYLTSVNSAWVLGPPLAGLILVNADYWKMYLAAFALLVPVYIILRITLNDFKDYEYKDVSPFSTLKQVWRDKNIFNIFMAVLFLQTFYCWMIIYTPIYLHANLGFDWGSIGIIFAVMLLPFVFIQFPAGKLADSKYGEKEMLSIGFVIMALATMVIFFVNGKSILVWSLILFGTRIGAALVEVMCDTYFFKKVNDKDANLISFYRMAMPFAYIIGPLLAVIVLSLPNFGIKNLFLILGFMMFFGLKFSLSLQDTK